MNQPTITIRAIEEKDFAQWNELYKGYIAFQKKPFDENNRDILWNWLMSHKIMALVALDNERLVGFAHYREMPHSLFARLVGFLDDLFVVPDYRGQQVAQLLMEHLKALGAKQHWLFIRWFVAENNYRAKGLYDKIAKKTIWHTYQLDI